MEQNTVEIKRVVIQKLNCITFNASIQDLGGGGANAPPHTPLHVDSLKEKLTQ